MTQTLGNFKGAPENSVNEINNILMQCLKKMNLMKRKSMMKKIKLKDKVSAGMIFPFTFQGLLELGFNPLTLRGNAMSKAKKKRKRHFRR